MELLNIKPIKLKRNIKKSAFEDSFFFMAVIFAICIVVLILVKSWTAIKDPLNEGLTSAMPLNATVNITTTLNGITSTTLLFDKLLPFVLIGLFAFVFIGAALYMNSPMMVFVGIIILAIAIMLGAIYANVYHQISGSDEFATTNAQLPIQEIFMQYLPYIMIILFVVITSAVIWSRSSGGGTL